MQLNGAQLMVRLLERQGVRTIAGIPGGAILPFYDALSGSEQIRHVLARHEQGAGFMAQGMARVSGVPQVCIASSGPGATNLVTAIADACLDSIPMVVITGQVPQAMIGTDAFQEVDIYGITVPITKHNFLVRSAQELLEVVPNAFRIAMSGRPGPVLIDVPKDVQNQLITIDEGELPAPAVADPTPPLDMAAVEAAAQMINAAERPVLYLGGGVVASGAAPLAVQLAEQAGLPTTMTLMGLGAMAIDHPLSIGMLGMHGARYTNFVLEESDLLIVVGARFDDRVTGKVNGFAPDAKIIHVDIDPAEQGKVRKPDVPIVGDCRLVIEEMVKAIQELLQGGTSQADLNPWRSRVSGWQEQFPLMYEQSEPGGPLKPQYCLEKLRDAAPEGTILVSGVGQHQMWSSQYWKFNEPYTWVNSGGLGTMGFSVPAAIGAKVGRPDKTVWAVDGDGCFQMTAQELVTASLERIPVKIAILNNSYLGMVRQWQEMFYEERYSEVYLSQDTPNYVKWAEAMGCVGIRVDDQSEVASAIDKANSINDRPVVVDFRVDAGEKVFPMVAAGQSNDDLMLHPSQNSRREFLR